MANNPKVVFKILILGDAMVGKTCVLQRYADNSFTEHVAPTIGVDYRPVYHEFRGKLTKLMIWDTAGQEKFKSITTSFYHGAHGAVIVYDVTQTQTLYGLRKWITELKHICGDIPIIIVGNKCDSKSKKKTPDEEITAFIEEIEFSDKHFFVSAYLGENVKEAFDALTELLLDNLNVYNASKENGITLSGEKKSSNCPC